MCGVLLLASRHLPAHAASGRIAAHLGASKALQPLGDLGGLIGQARLNDLFVAMIHTRSPPHNRSTAKPGDLTPRRFPDGGLLGRAGGTSRNAHNQGPALV
jgi:hypothetical protein